MSLMEDGNLCTIHVKQVTIMPKDTQFSLPHPGRASTLLKSSSTQANLLFVGCAGFSFCLCLVLVQGREFKRVKYAKLARDLVC